MLFRAKVRICGPQFCIKRPVLDSGSPGRGVPISDRVELFEGGFYFHFFDRRPGDIFLRPGFDSRLQKVPLRRPGDIFLRPGFIILRRPGFDSRLQKVPLRRPGDVFRLAQIFVFRRLGFLRLVGDIFGQILILRLVGDDYLLPILRLVGVIFIFDQIFILRRPGDIFIFGVDFRRLGDQDALLLGLGVAAQEYLHFGALGFDLGLVDIFAKCEQINRAKFFLANDEQETLLCGNRSERLFDRLLALGKIHDAVACGSEHRLSGYVDAAQMDLSHNEEWGLLLVKNRSLSPLRDTLKIPLHYFDGLGQ